MRKTFLICFISLSSICSQSNFWSHYSLNIPIRQLVKTPDGVIYAVTDSTILKSTDYGNIWSVFFVASNPISPNSFRLEVNTNSSISYTFIVRRSGWNSFYPQISTNGGANWQNLSFPGSYFRDVSISSNGDIYLLSDTLYKSTDNGVSWNPINTPTEYWMASHLSIDENDNIYLNRGKRFWLYDPFGFPIYTWWEDKIYRSSDYGQNWQFLFYLWDEDQIIQMYTIPQNNVLFDYSYKDATHHFGNGYDRDLPLNEVNWAIFENNFIKYTSSSTQGISFSSNNGQTWFTENSGLPNLHTYSILRDSLGYLYTGTDNGIFKSNITSYSLSTEANYQFEDTRLDDTTYKQITLNNPYPFNLIIDSLVCTADNFFVSASTYPIIPPNGNLIIDIGFKPEELGNFVDHLNLYAGNIRGRIKLTGACPFPTLLEVQAPNFGAVPIGDTTFSFLVYTSQSLNKITIDTLYLKHEQDFYLENIQFPVELEAADTISFRIFFSPHNLGQRADTIIILSNTTPPQLSKGIVGQGISPVVLQFINFGTVPIGDTATSILKVISRSSNNVVIDSAYLKQRQDFFLENIQFPKEILPNDTTSIKVYFSPLFVGQRVDTIFVEMNIRNFQISRRVLGQGSNPNNIENEEKIVTEYSLSNCYPNPFNPTTTIEYSVPKLSNVKISVFNLVGEEIAIIVNEEKTQGNYKVEFNGSKLSSGVYFYKMQAENFVVTKKFVLLK